MASSASKRLFKEYKALSSDPPEGITAGPINEDDMFLWEALIQGPEGTPFEGGVFPAELRFPKDYPLAPPKMKFVTDMWHPNGTFFPCLQIPYNLSACALEKDPKLTGRDCSLPQWRSVHIYPPRAWRRSDAIRASVRAVVADSKRGEDSNQCDEHVGRAER